MNATDVKYKYKVKGRTIKPGRLQSMEGRQKVKNNEMMNVKEVSRLIEWLKAKGMTAEDVTDCINYIAGNPEIKKDPDSTESSK